MIDVKGMANEQKAAVRAVTDRYPKGSIRLAVIQVGDDPASSVYIRGKLKDCLETGIEGEHFHFPADADAREILDLIEKKNAEEACKGILVQLPLPKQFSKETQQKILGAISVEKDVDGFRGESRHLPCTPRGILYILDAVAQKRGWASLEGKVACVIGRSQIVGKPMANLLIERGCTVISCNSHTADLDRWLSQSDIIVSAVGRADFLTLDRKVDYAGKIIIDVGINRDAEGKLCGDCSRALYDVVEDITPVPGGVGLMTRSSLMENVVDGL